MPEAQPIFTKRDPATGAVLFDFTGHVHAAGLDLDSVESAPTVSPDHRVNWINPADGRYKAAVAGYHRATDSGYQRAMLGLPDPTGFAATSFLAYLNIEHDGANTGAIEAYSGSGSGATSLVTITNSSMQSSFLQKSGGVSGPFLTGTAGPLATATDQAMVVNHNLGLSAAQIANAVIVGHLLDGFFSALASWRLNALTTNSVTINIGNPSARNDIQAALKFYIAT